MMRIQARHMRFRRAFVVGVGACVSCLAFAQGLPDLSKMEVGVIQKDKGTILISEQADLYLDWEDTWVHRHVGYAPEGTIVFYRPKSKDVRYRATQEIVPHYSVVTETGFLGLVPCERVDKYESEGGKQTLGGREIDSDVVGRAKEDLRVCLGDWRLTRNHMKDSGFWLSFFAKLFRVNVSDVLDKEEEILKYLERAPMEDSPWHGKLEEQGLGKHFKALEAHQRRELGFSKFQKAGLTELQRCVHIGILADREEPRHSAKMDRFVLAKGERPLAPVIAVSRGELSGLEEVGTIHESVPRQDYKPYFDSYMFILDREDPRHTHRALVDAMAEKVADCMGGSPQDPEPRLYANYLAYQVAVFKRNTQEEPSVIEEVPPEPPAPPPTHTAAVAPPRAGPDPEGLLRLSSAEIRRLREQGRKPKPKRLWVVERPVELIIEGVSLLNPFNWFK